MGSIFSEFIKTVENSRFFKLADEILLKEKDPETLARCAEISKQREPGGTYYQYTFWNKAIFELEDQYNGTTNIELAKICKSIGLNTQTALTYSKRGQIISKAELKDEERQFLKFANSKVLENAIKRG